MSTSGTTTSDFFSSSSFDCFSIAFSVSVGVGKSSTDVGVGRGGGFSLLDVFLIGSVGVVGVIVADFVGSVFGVSGCLLSGFVSDLVSFSNLM